MARLDAVRKATVCAVFAALAAAGCSAGQASSAARLSPGAVAPATAGSGHSPGARGSAAAGQVPASSVPGVARSSASAPSPDGSATASATATPTPVAGNITVGPAGDMLQGPMKITAVYCGKLSAAQRAQFGTTAAGGLIYRYANVSAGVDGSAKLYVGFTTGGGNLTGANYAGTVPAIAPGKSAEAEVDAVGVQGQDLSFTGCEIISYALITPTGVDPVSYAG